MEIRRLTTPDLIAAGIIAYEKRDFDSAKRHLLTACDREPKNWRAKLYLAMAYLYSGDVLLAANLLRFLQSNCPESEYRNKAAAVLDSVVASKSRSLHEISYVEIKHKAAGEPTSSASTTHNKNIQRVVNTTNGQKFSLAEVRTTIGRDKSNQISLVDDNFVSQFQAAIIRDKCDYFLEDMITVNATRINGKSITGKTRLSPGDLIKVGKTQLRVE